MPPKPRSKPLASMNKENLRASSKQGPATKSSASNNMPGPSHVEDVNLMASSQEASGSAQIQAVSEDQDLDRLSTAPVVNRKKQKRRMKEAAKKAASGFLEHEHSIDALASHTNGFNHDTGGGHKLQIEPFGKFDALYDGQPKHTHNGHLPDGLEDGHDNHNYIVQEPPGVSKKRNKRHELDNSTDRNNESPPRIAPPLSTSIVRSRSTATVPHTLQAAKEDRIWNTSTAEERERIKDFWLGLGENDRRGLVRIEKEAVLKKMKEQQKHSCSCTVCGRKRTAIEEELEVLYDAYYEELETYAHHQHFGLDASKLSAPRAYGHHISPVPTTKPFDLASSSYSQVGQAENYDPPVDVYADKDEDDELSDGGGIFSFGNSLTAKGGILTVADDLLKNDGKKFIEMMEQLAERRMQREEESRMIANGGNSQVLRREIDEDEESFDEDDDDGDYNSEEEDEFDEEQLEALSEEQRMEEGRRMFQIFAARMFEQRVLNAYRKKVAEERQARLIEELAEAEEMDAQQKAKKATQAQKKKDKRLKQKQAKDEHKSKKEAEKAAELAALKAIEEKKAEEQRMKKEEQRRKKEAEKKAAEDERKRKEDERQSQERKKREQKLELEKKQREQKEREKRQQRENSKLKEQEERDSRAREKSDREVVAQKERNTKFQTDGPAKEQAKQEDPLASHAKSIPKQPSPANTATLSTHNSLQTSHSSSAHASPRLPIATPVLPKPPTPVRMRQRSTQESRNASPKPTYTTTNYTASPVAPGDPPRSTKGEHSRKVSQPSAKQPSGHPSRFSPINAPPGLGVHSNSFMVPTPQIPNSFPDALVSPLSPVGQTSGLQDSMANGTTLPRHANMPYPPGFSSVRQPSASQQAPIGMKNPEATPNKVPLGQFGVSNESGRAPLHSRNPSASSNISPRDFNQRPAPIQRPSSVAPPQSESTENARPSNQDVDDLSGQLGSSALIDDTEDPAQSAIEELRRGSVAVEGPQGSRQSGFPSAPGFAPIGTSIGPQVASKMWNQPPGISTNHSFNRQPYPSNIGQHKTASNVIPGPQRPGGMRLLRIRQLVCMACEKLSHFNPNSHGWHLAEHIVGEVQTMVGRNEGPVHIMEVLHACDSDSTSQNGGGYFDFREKDGSGFIMRYVPDHAAVLDGRKGSLAVEIGSAGSGTGIVTANPGAPGQGVFQRPPGLPSGGSNF